MKQRVLIVDDNEENINVLGNFLVNKGFIIQIAQDGNLAIKTARKKSPDIILLDISMPGMSGYEVCEILHKDRNTKEIPIIFLSAHIETDDITRGFSLGAVDYITKPFQDAELLARVKTHLKLRRMREHLKKKNQKLKNINAVKDKLFSIISHDLRSPNGAILNIADLAMEDITNGIFDNIGSYCSLIRESSRQSFELLSNLLQWSRIERGHIEFQPVSLELTQLIQKIIRLLRPGYENKQIQLETSFHVQENIHADEFMLETIIRNLISNAIKFTNQQGRIHISTSKHKDHISIVIDDSGVGIAKENIDKLFQIQLQSTRGTNHEKGTGLGLLLCKDFVDRHGGSIQVESEPSKGTKVIVSLPLIFSDML